MDTTVVKALSLLEALARSDEPRGVTELANETGLTKANVHRLLRTLLAHGYVIQHEDHAKYALSTKMWQLGSRAISRLDVSDVARPVVRDLCAQADESVQFAIPDGDAVIYVDKADSTHPLRATTQIGSRVPAHCVSSGKSMLAFSEELRSRLKYPLARYTPTTITKKPALEAEFARIREAGYSVNRGEWREGVWGIAAPIFDARGKVIASIGIWGTESRLGGASIKRLGGIVAAAASRISSQLGHAGPAHNNPTPE